MWPVNNGVQSTKIAMLILILSWLKKIPEIFYNLWGYESHLIMQEIGKFEVKTDVIPNELEKRMAFTVNGNLVFIDSMQFMKSRCLG